MVGGGGGEGVSYDQFPTFDAEFKSAKIPKSHYGFGGGGGGGHWQPISNFAAESKSAKFPKSHYGLRGGGGRGQWQPISNFAAESKSAKFPKSHYSGGRRRVSDNQFPTFDAESKSAKIPKFHYGGVVTTNFQLLTFKSQLQNFKVKSQLKFPFPGDEWLVTTNSCAENVLSFCHDFTLALSRRGHQ